MSLFRIIDDGANEDDPFSSDLYRAPDGSGFERVQDAEEASTHVKVRLRLYAGEVKRDTRVGVLFFGFIDDPRTPERAVASHLVSIITGTPGIVDAQLRFELETTRGIMLVEFDAIYSPDDQSQRRTIHESFFVRVSGLGVAA